jgi:hypothetical protein
MKMWQYITLIVMGLLAVGAAIAIVILALATEDLQRDLQARQARLSGGILGQQGQAVSASILQDMANAAPVNPRMRSLLSKHGYNVAGGTQTNAAPEKAAE